MPTIEHVAIDGSLMDVHLYEPEQSAAAPLILLMYPRSGLDGFPQRIAAAFAGEGYRVAIPEISHRQNLQVPVRDRKQFLKDAEIVDDIRATISFCRPGSGVVIMGHCMGGRHAFLGASCITEITGAIPYYSADMFEAWGGTASPYDLLDKIRCPVIGFFGDKDRNPGPADVDRIAYRLSTHQVHYDFHRYPDVGHAFQQNAERSPEERKAADDSTLKAIAFLKAVTGR